MAEIRIRAVPQGKTGSGPFASAQRKDASADSAPARPMEIPTEASARTGLLAWADRFDLLLLGAAVAVYLATRLIALEDYPIYFFTDEAVQTVLAQDFVRDGLRDFAGRPFPTYFLNVYEYNLNLSVYAQVLPLLAFGKSVFVTRAIPAVLSALGAASLAYLVGRFFAVRFWWSAVLFLGITPAWFLHSRTAFETTLMATFYGMFLVAYLLYRLVDPRYLYLSVLLAAMVFYTYGPGQIISLATGLLLFVSDIRYHWAHRRLLAGGLAWAALLALPYLRFQVEQPGAHQEFLRLLDSYWLRELPLARKIATAAANYASALSPAYWLGADRIDLPRHLMDGHGNLSRWAAPFLAVGGFQCIRTWDRPASRLLLAALLAVPFGAVVVGVGITRVLSWVMPAAALSALGLAWAVRWTLPRLPYRPLAATAFVLLSGLQVLLLGDALRNGPTWSDDYGLYGMQYGARQVFQMAQEHVLANPDDHVFVTSTWANGADVLARFFVADPSAVTISSATPWAQDPLELNDRMAFLVTADEREELQQNPKFLPPEEIGRILYPNGAPGFFLVRLRYSPRAEAIFAEEQRLRQIPIVEQIEIGGAPVTVEHPLLDMGEIPLLFDGDEFTLIRTFEANPAVFVFTFASPRPLRGLALTAGAFSFELRLRLTSAAGETVVYGGVYTLPADQPTIEVAFDRGPPSTAHLEVEILHLFGAGRVKIHLRELRFLEED